MAYKKIGKKLQKAREEAGLSQKELARRLGCTQASLSNYELGKRRLYLAELQHLSEILGKPVTFFLEDIDEAEDAEPVDLNEIVKNDPYLEEILSHCRELEPEQRKTVLDFIKWQKREEG